MLELKAIKKTYKTGDEEVQALKGVDLQFRENEFVAILGQSGCGKTTMLNIIGGLDKYTSGDLVINGRSTKDYKDRDWDTYRNHSIGFVFQSYNLIPHQTVLSNVELALTLSGVSKEERRKRAVKVLEEVGLKDQINKKPNQMSGGQMQRVAIARALINDPDILLADEPTGALDSTTSLQIMELLKKIAKEKSVIMVTHNPELAKQYATRIIQLKDGEVVDDSDPVETKLGSGKIGAAGKKTSMSFFTALSLSLNNLITKKGRTFITAFAGSIGIIGIALIMSLSNGVQEYITKVEEDTLSSYPISIEKTTMDMSAMLSIMMGRVETSTEEREENRVYSTALMGNMLESMSNGQTDNNLELFKVYLESGESQIPEATSAIQYSYALDLNVYNENAVDGLLQVNPTQVMNTLGLGQSMEMQSNFMPSAMMSYDIWTELLNNQEMLEAQYDVVSGVWPKAYDEVVLMIGEDNTITDYTLYSLGLLSQEELAEKLTALITGGEIVQTENKSYTYDELIGMNFKLMLNTDYYVKENDVWLDKRTDEEAFAQIVSEATELKIVGIVKPNEEAIAMTNTDTGLIGYTESLKEHIINEINNSEIVKEQIANPEINVFTGMEFPAEVAAEFDYSSLTEEEKQYMAMLSDEELMEMMAAYQSNSQASYDGNITTLGVVDLEQPSSIRLYPKNFESKDIIENDIKEYNEGQIEEDQITYRDIVGAMMSSITSIIDIISYVLIAFVSVSLIVSSIMIGIITYISVLERTKEIGILRSIGASKKDISRVFNAETFIIGLFSGSLGIGITLLLSIPINIIVKNGMGVSNITSLPVAGGVGLILISLALTVIAGLIPSKLASKKDPVVALRSE